MRKDYIKGGKADKLSVEDIAKKHGVSVAEIKAQIDMGKKVEMEHVKDEKLSIEISMDHLEEIPDYYTRLKKMEKDAKKELSLEAKRFMALAGIKEGNKKFLTNEAFQQTTREEKDEDGDDFIVLEFEQIDVPPGEEDNLYKIKTKKDD